ncbi:hypothetical protein ACTMTJ_36265 [Phytohabitans sp. LJ34]|uniref:hypothetical protein n=1 Tax=Phytohabitans sp. LJ34 TaxID=3452217 RepID=UPI003F886A87
MTERSRAATPSPWRRPGPSVQLPPPPPPAATMDIEPEERRRGSRRLIRWFAVVVGIILAVLACWQDPLYAL